MRRPPLLASDSPSLVRMGRVSYQLASRLVLLIAIATLRPLSAPKQQRKDPGSVSLFYLSWSSLVLPAVSFAATTTTTTTTTTAASAAAAAAAAPTSGSVCNASYDLWGTYCHIPSGLDIVAHDANSPLVPLGFEDGRLHNDNLPLSTLPRLEPRMGTFKVNKAWKWWTNHADPRLNKGMGWVVGNKKYGIFANVSDIKGLDPTVTDAHLIVRFDKPVWVKAIAMQARVQRKQIVKKFRFSVSMDGLVWRALDNMEDGRYSGYTASDHIRFDDPYNKPIKVLKFDSPAYGSYYKFKILQGDGLRIELYTTEELQHRGPMHLQCSGASGMCEPCCQPRLHYFFGKEPSPVERADFIRAYDGCTALCNGTLLIDGLPEDGEELLQSALATVQTSRATIVLQNSAHVTTLGWLHNLERLYGLELRNNEALVDARLGANLNAVTSSVISVGNPRLCMQRLPLSGNLSAAPNESGDANSIKCALPSLGGKIEIIAMAGAAGADDGGSGSGSSRLSPGIAAWIEDAVMRSLRVTRGIGNKTVISSYIVQENDQSAGSRRRRRSSSNVAEALLIKYMVDMLPAEFSMLNFRPSLLTEELERDVPSGVGGIVVSNETEVSYPALLLSPGPLERTGLEMEMKIAPDLPGDRAYSRAIFVRAIDNSSGVESSESAAIVDAVAAAFRSAYPTADLTGPEWTRTATQFTQAARYVPWDVLPDVPLLNDTTPSNDSNTEVGSVKFAISRLAMARRYEIKAFLQDLTTAQYWLSRPFIFDVPVWSAPCGITTEQQDATGTVSLGVGSGDSESSSSGSSIPVHSVLLRWTLCNSTSLVSAIVITATPVQQTAGTLYSSASLTMSSSAGGSSGGDGDNVGQDGGGSSRVYQERIDCVAEPGRCDAGAFVVPAGSLLGDTVYRFALATESNTTTAFYADAVATTLRTAPDAIGSEVSGPGSNGNDGAANDGTNAASEDLEDAIIAASAGGAAGAVLVLTIALAVYYRQRQRQIRLQKQQASDDGAGADGKRVSFPLIKAGAWELNTSSISLGSKLGAGAFGVVYKGEVSTGAETTTVAVKMYEPSHGGGSGGGGGGRRDDAGNLKEFVDEALLMMQLCTQGHPNVVKLQGVCMQKEPAMIVIEYMARGDLLAVLRAARPSGRTMASVSVLELTRIAHCVASGMAYLAEQRFVHRDLACRNLLVDGRGTVKVADFGLSRKLSADKDYYRKNGRALLPVRWMSPEALLDSVHTSQGDVWSFAVVLYEIYTLGDRPYAGLSNEEVFEGTAHHGLSCEQVPNCPDVVYGLAAACQANDPVDRPSFSALEATLEGICYRQEKSPLEEDFECCVPGGEQIPRRPPPAEHDSGRGYGPRLSEAW